MANRTVSVSLVADVAQYQSAMTKAAQATKSVGASAEESSGRIRRGFDVASKGAVLLGGLMAGGVALGIKSVIGAASDLNETLNKSNVIFGDQSGRIAKWADGAAKNFGLSKQAALEAAASFGNMFQQLGFAGDQAAGMSTNVVKLAADLGSFNNLETGDVLERIQAAFRGEYDSLQLLIPNINAARVESEALAETGKENAKQLTAQEKAAATLAIVQKDGAAAANDFAETSSGLANSTKIAAAEFEDLKSRIGQDLLPVAQSAMHFFSETAIPVMESVYGTVKNVVGGFSDLPGPLQAAAVAGVGWAIAGDRIVGALKPMGGLLSGAGGTWRAFGEALGYARANGDGLGTVLKSVGDYAGGQTLSAVKKLGRAIGPELGIAAGAFVITGFIDGLRSMTEASDEAKAATEGLANALTLTDRAADRRAIRTAIEDVDGLVEVLDKAGVSSEDAINGLLGQADAQGRVNAAIQNYITLNPGGIHNKDAEAARQARENYEELATGYGTAAGNARFFAEEAEGAAAGAEATGDAAAGTVPQVDEAAQAIQRWREQLAGINDSFVEPLGIYKGLLQEAAQATADSTKSSKDSWQDYADSASVSLDQFALKLQDQITAQENWRTNLVLISQRGGAEVAQILAGMGEEGAGLVQQMVNANAEDFGRMRDLMIRDAQLGGSGAAAALDTQMRVMAEIGAQGGSATAKAVADKLGLGLADVRGIAAQYGLDLATGLEPLLTALGQRNIALRARGEGMHGGGNYYDGGYTGPGGKHQPAGIVHAGEVVWSQEDVAAHGGPQRVDSMRRARQGYASGGFVSVADVPRPRSTAPYGPPISTAGDAAMDTAYQATVNYVREQGPFGRALAWARSQVGKPYIWGGVGPAGYDCSGFMSAITNVILGRSPYSRVGATANFPWPGFAPGNNGVFNIGSIGNAGGGIGHMAGDVLGVPVESTGGVGVIVGAGARSSKSSLFSTRAHLAMASGGVIGEPVVGQGVWSGRSYSFAERGDEVVLPRGREVSGGGRGGATVVKVAAPDLRGLTIQGRVTVDGDGIATIAGRVVDHKLGEITNDLEYATGS